MRKHLSSCLAILLFVTLISGCGAGKVVINTEDGNATWKYPLGSIYNSGTSPFSPSPSFAVTWEKTLPNKTSFSPVVAGGALVIPDDNGNIYCLSTETGEVVWSKKLGNNISQPIIGANMVYLGVDNKMLALNISDGNSIWESELEGEVVGYPLNDGGKLWFVTEHDLYCLEESKGGQVFHKDYDKHTFTQAPTLQKYLYLVAGKQLIAFNDYDLVEAWSLYLKDDLIAPVSCQRSSIFAVDGNLYKIDDKNGDVLESYSYNAPTPSGEIVDSTEYGAKLITGASVYMNIICTTTEHGNVIALTDSVNGLSFLWSLGVTFPIKAPVLIGNDYVYFGAGDGRFYVGSTSNGQWVWHNRFGLKEAREEHLFVSSPAILNDKIFVVSVAGLIKRFDIGGRPMTQEEMTE